MPIWIRPFDASISRSQKLTLTFYTNASIFEETVAGGRAWRWSHSCPRSFPGAEDRRVWPWPRGADHDAPAGGGGTDQRGAGADAAESDGQRAAHPESVVAVQSVDDGRREVGRDGWLRVHAGAGEGPEDCSSDRRSIGKRIYWRLFQTGLTFVSNHNSTHCSVDFGDRGQREWRPIWNSNGLIGKSVPFETTINTILSGGADLCIEPRQHRTVPEICTAKTAHASMQESEPFETGVSVFCGRSKYIQFARLRTAALMLDEQPTCFLASLPVGKASAFWDQFRDQRISACSTGGAVAPSRSTSSRGAVVPWVMCCGFATTPHSSSEHAMDMIIVDDHIRWPVKIRMLCSVALQCHSPPL